MGVEIGIYSHVTQKISMRIVLILAHKCAKINENKMIIDYLLIQPRSSNITYYVHLYVLNDGEDNGDDVLNNGSGQCQNRHRSVSPTKQI